MKELGYSGKVEADQLFKVTIYKLREWGYLRLDCRKNDVLGWRDNFTKKEYNIDCMVSTHRNNEFVRFDYTIIRPSGNTEGSQRFLLTTTSCHFGGGRYWFVCSSIQNSEKCGRRVGVLYLSHISLEFSCRHCLNLTYSSRKLSGRFKAAGNIISSPDVSRMKEAVRRKYYNGKPTRKYVRYLKIATKARYAYAMHLGIATDMAEERNSRVVKMLDGEPPEEGGGNLKIAM